MDQEAFAELGLEGLDKFATKYHDKVVDHAPAWRQRQHNREHHPEKYARNERERERQRAHSNPPDQRDRDRDRDGDNRDYRDHRDYPSERSARPRDRDLDTYNSTPRHRDLKEPTSIMSDRTTARGYAPSEATRYRTSDRKSQPTARDPLAATYYPVGAPPSSASIRNPYPADSVILERSRYAHRAQSRSRSRSRSRTRNTARNANPNQRPRASSESKSAVERPFITKHRYTPTLVGAVAGGLAGRNVSDGDRLTTVISAVVGAIGAKQGYKTYEKRKEKKNRKEDREWRDEHGSESESDDVRSDYEEERGDRWRGGRGGRVQFSRSQERERERRR